MSDNTFDLVRNTLWSPAQTDAYHNGIIAAIEGLTRDEKAGRAVDLRDGDFKYAVGSPFVFYTLSETSVDVVGVLHQRVDVSRPLSALSLDPRLGIPRICGTCPHPSRPDLAGWR